MLHISKAWDIRKHLKTNIIIIIIIIIMNFTLISSGCIFRRVTFDIF